MRKAVPGSGTLAHMMDVSSERAQAIREYFANQYDRVNRRKPNPLFAGRDEELNRVLRYAIALDRAEHPEENMTALFYGAPGSGKSEMLTQLRAALRDALTKPECFVRHLHKAETGLKVLTVYGGLGNTPNLLAKCGVTRPGQHMRFPLKRLDPEDARNIATEALAATTDKPEDVIAMWAGEIVEFAQGWPAHLNTALRAVATHAQPNGWRLDPDGFNSAMTAAHENRRTYYEDRLDRCERLGPRQYSRWAALMRRTHTVRAHNVGAALGLSDEDANALTADAVAAGLLEPLGGRKYATPIPALLRHIEAEGVSIDREYE